MDFENKIMKILNYTSSNFFFTEKSHIFLTVCFINENKDF